MPIFIILDIKIQTFWAQIVSRFLLLTAKEHIAIAKMWRCGGNILRRCEVESAKKRKLKYKYYTKVILSWITYFSTLCCATHLNVLAFTLSLFFHFRIFADLSSPLTIVSSHFLSSETLLLELARYLIRSKRGRASGHGKKPQIADLWKLVLFYLVI